jgi:post-segregation antitoxin (ccd killing protein)
MEVNKKNRVKVTWSIDADLIKKIKHEAVDREIDTSTIVEEALKKHLRQQ